MMKQSISTAVFMVYVALNSHAYLECGWSPVAPGVIAITVRTQRIESGRQRPFEAQATDEVKLANGRHRVVYRNGKPIGTLVGREKNILFTFDRVIGTAPAPSLLDNAKTYSVESPDDKHYSKPVSPLQVYRKTRPYGDAVVDWPGTWRKFEPLVENILFLKLPAPLSAGKQYTISTGIEGWQDQTFTYAPKGIRSDAVHVSHVGFRPDDPVKIAFLSCWMGTGGGL